MLGVVSQELSRPSHDQLGQIEGDHESELGLPPAA